MNPIRTAVVGYGYWGPNLVRNVIERPELEFAGLCELDPARAAAFSAKVPDAPVFTDLAQVVSNPEIDAVLVATPPHTHHPIVAQALRGGKHVLVEKPLALTAEELLAIEHFYGSGRAAPPVLMTGFNRRFAPPVVALLQALEGRSSPMIVNYRMNAGFIPAEHWVHGPEGGGRNIGEACHIYDLFAALTRAAPLGVCALAIEPAGRQWHRNDNFVATIRYSDGSVCTLTYTALGSKQFPKERMDVFCDGKVYVLDDYKSLRVHGARKGEWSASSQNKGQYEELEALARCIGTGGQWPISLADQLATTRVSFDVEAQLARGGALAEQ
jgi:predicted dehydrogenase